MGSDGRHAVKLTPPGVDDFTPAWSPVASRIAFARLDRTNPALTGLYVARANGTGVRRVVGDDASAPSWSPDGRRIAFLRPGRGLSVIDADGTNHRRLSVQSSERVDWSPDGRRVLFVEGDHVFLMNANGGGKRRLTERCQQDNQPAWSPDGSKVAFTCDCGNADVYTINVAGTQMRPLTRNGGTDWFPAWSPDGKWIAWAAYRNGLPAVWVMRSAGTQPRRVTAYTFDSELTWDPSRG